MSAIPTWEDVRLAIAHLEDPAVRPVVPRDIVMMALVLVVPVDHEDAAVWSTAEADDLRPTVIGQEEVIRMVPHEARAFPFERVAVQLPAARGCCS